MIISEKICNSEVERVLLKRIEEIYKSNDNDEFCRASDYCDILLEANGSNIYAALYSPFLNMSTSYEDIPKYSLVVAAVQLTLVLAKDQLGVSDEYYDFCLEAFKRVGDKFASYIRSLCVAFRIVKKQYESDPELDQYTIRKNCSELSVFVGSAMSEVAKDISKFFSEWLQAADPETAPKSLAESIKEVIENIKSAIHSSKSENWVISVSELNQAGVECDKLISKIHKLLVEKYWMAHPDEKEDIERTIAQLTEEKEIREIERENVKKEIDDEVAQAEAEMDNIEDEFDEEKAKIDAQIKEVEEEKSKQGFFAFGAKKDLKNKIEEKQKQIEALEKEKESKFTVIEEKIEAIRERGRVTDKEYSDKISALKAKITKNQRILDDKEE